MFIACMYLKSKLIFVLYGVFLSILSNKPTNGLTKLMSPTHSIETDLRVSSH